MGAVQRPGLLWSQTSGSHTPAPQRAGGTLEQRTLASLDDITEAAAVVNCSGMGAALLAADPELRPIQGQHVVVENPGITEFFSEDTGYSPELVCTYPHGDTIVLGGTAIEDEYLAEAVEPAARGVVDRNAAIDPRLAKARVIEHRVGQRPTRPEVRVEADHRRAGTPVIHNYGHGGAGVTLSWGCAGEVATLLAVQSEE
ncbi:glycine/D-amino acid oxidase-like deaminating enzyme [Streptomyces sp. LBL]|uniref:FAD-dependent oxidoreductase n=1 Tax=Streptomyces sp. LBL TaxID=2940562 RepID=UPI00247EE03D|nr:glycine/D-amino acid oxidase-like deaminating enzyme [Streptomyces sp. LBL]